MSGSAKADIYLAQVYKTLQLTHLSDLDKFNRVEEIVAQLAIINKRKAIHVATTGTITERLCRLALVAYLTAEGFERLPQSWKWLADYSVLGRPLNVLISVKSFKAKERLLMSGSGSAIAPTIGFGLFDDVAEWSVDRLSAYLLRGFVAIYMPKALLTALAGKDERILQVSNLNGKKLLRPLDRFGVDLASALIGDRVDPRSL